MDPTERSEWVAYIAEVNDEAVEAKAKVEARVIEARKRGVSWNIIAEGVGITRQAATERFGKLPELDKVP